MKTQAAFQRLTSEKSIKGKGNSTSQFKTKVAFEAAKTDKIISQIASEHGLHLQQVIAYNRNFSITSISCLRKKITPGS